MVAGVEAEGVDMVERELLLDRRPRVHPRAYIAPGAVLLGDVSIEEDASIWFNCVLRGDVNYIRVGKRSNIQDLTLCHGLIERFPVIVGEDVTVGHCAILHACVVEDWCLIGMGSRVLSGAVVGAESIVAAGALVKEGMKVPPRSLVVGVPGVVKRPLNSEELDLIRSYTGNYLSYMRSYRDRAPEIASLLWSPPEGRT